MSLHIFGRACPYNVENSYRETIAPGAFAEFLKYDLKGERLPMCFMHEEQCGWWSEFKEGDDGLWVRGVIQGDRACALVLSGEIPELSITFSDMDDNYVLTRNRVLDKMSIIGEPPPPEFSIVERRVTKRAELAEISIVDLGAFPGTRFKIERSRQ